MIAAAILKYLDRPRVINVVLDFYAQGVTWRVEGDVYLSADSQVARLDDASGSVYGRVCWYMGARFRDVLGRVDSERLDLEMIAAAEAKLERGR